MQIAPVVSSCPGCERSDADVRIGRGRLSELGNSTTPVAVRSRSTAGSSALGASAENAIKLEDSPSPGPVRHSRARSVVMEEAPALRPVGVMTTASRSQYLRRPRFDYQDPAARAVYEAQLLEELEAVRSDEFLPGSPSTPSEEGHTTPSEQLQEELEAVRSDQGAASGVSSSGRGQFRGTHIRFLSSGSEGSESDGGEDN